MRRTITITMSVELQSHVQGIPLFYALRCKRVFLKPPCLAFVSLEKAPRALTRGYRLGMSVEIGSPPSSIVLRLCTRCLPVLVLGKVIPRRRPELPHRMQCCIYWDRFLAGFEKDAKDPAHTMM